VVRKRVVFAALAGVAGILLLAIGLAAYTRHALSQFAADESQRTAYIFSAGQRLVPGVHVRLIDLAGTLARLGYRETTSDPTRPGEFRRATGSWHIMLHASDDPAAAPAPRDVVLELRGERIARVVVDGVEAKRVRLEGEVLASAGDETGDESRPVTLAEIPQSLISAVLAIEDHRFFEHGGIDLRGLARAAWVNTRSGRVAQGGSTITQQLVKNRLLSAERTFARKLREAWLAAVLDWRYSKETLLEAYLNEIYLGQRGGLAIRGVGSAARIYFHKEVHQLGLAESALLSGMIRAPNTYSPSSNPERAKARRSVTLARMRELGWIDEAEMTAADSEPLPTPGLAVAGQAAAYFTDFVRQQIEQTIGDEPAASTIMARVYTSLDMTLQRFAETAVSRGLDRIERGYARLRRDSPSKRLQAALIALDPASGDIVAMVGGRDYRASQFNRAVFAKRQPGSAFKPFVFATALAPFDDVEPLTPSSMIDDEPITLKVGGKDWMPRNHDGVYEGRVTVRRALERSLNAATVRIAAHAGLDRIVDTARQLGITSPLEPVPSLSLGAFEVTPLELATAYSAFANGGTSWKRAGTTRAAFDSHGEPISVPRPQGSTVLTPAQAYVMTSLLQGVVDHGTASSARAAGIASDLAGKTGTTNEGRDAWFVGYTPRLLALVWVGFDDGEPHRLTAAQAALPIWTDFMKQAIDAYPVPAFEVPEGITWVEIDITNGSAANRYCPARAREVFLAGTEPPPCSVHVSPVDRAVDQAIDVWKRFKGWLGR
jgi:penicillin-binding protein 1B